MSSSSFSSDNHYCHTVIIMIIIIINIYIMIGEASGKKCTIDHAFVIFRENNTRLDHLSCCLSCVTQPLIFHQLISIHRLQMNNNSENYQFYYSSNPFCIIKRAKWHVIVEWKKVNKNNSLISCSLDCVSQAAEFSTLVESWSNYINQALYPIDIWVIPIYEMSYSEAHSTCAFQTPKHCWLTEKNTSVTIWQACAAPDVTFCVWPILPASCE